MKTQKYAVNQHLIETILSWVRAGEIAIPEIQRPFVWSPKKVRNLMDSLYQGYPVGYLIAWRNPNVKLKDGSTSEGKKILIDGQQRVTAFMAAMLGRPVINKDYRQVKIRIAFNPLTEAFEVLNSAIHNDRSWIPDIAPLVSGEQRSIPAVRAYLEHNPNADEVRVENSICNLTDMTKKQLGLIELDSDLDIETVTKIFVRINAEGVVLSQADFAMSKIASNEKYGGPRLRKCIDYFCHLAVAPEFYNQIVDVDHEFTSTPFFQKMAWLRNENDDLYDPEYTDLLRVAFTSEFNRGRLADLVSLLSGRNFEAKTYEEAIAEESFKKLETGILNCMNETGFKRFLMIIKSAGFISPGLIRSKNALNFAYIVYLKLRSEDYPADEIEKYVRRWFVLTLLTGRYSGSPETRFDYDIRQISGGKMKEFLANMEQGELSDAYWNTTLPRKFTTSVASSPYFNVYLAAQVTLRNRGFLSKHITVADLIAHRGDIHHIFPKDYLKKHGKTKSEYNQIANYAYMQSEINIGIGNVSPRAYFSNLHDQCAGGEAKHGGITDLNDLRTNLGENGIPEDISCMEVGNYRDFLERRRVLMAQKIKDYYHSL
jgi:hypothetical protein